jgi:hypothetical protein
MYNLVNKKKNRFLKQGEELCVPAKPSTPLPKLKVLLWIQPQALFFPIILPQPKNTCDIEVS